MKHTPGPWRVTSKLVGPLHLETEGGETLAHVGHDNFATCSANAELMAAAPDLLEALDELVGIVQGALDDPNLYGLGMDSFTLQPARAALAKAGLGEQGEEQK